MEAKERKLQFRRLATGEIVGGDVDVTGHSERNVERIMLGMLRNMHEDLYVHDTATNSTRERKEMSEKWRIDCSDEGVYRIDAVKDGQKEVVCEFKRDDAQADAREIMDAFKCVEAQDEEIKRITALIHRLEAHPDYEYTLTTGARKCFDEEPPSGEGWERNVHRGRNGWERFDYHEEAYWMRKLEERG